MAGCLFLHFRTLGVLAAMCLLLLFFGREMLVAQSGILTAPGPALAIDPNPTLISNWKQLAAAQPYVYQYYTDRMGFPMLSLGQRVDPACPGGPDAPPYVTVNADGRLGNLILEYAGVWALARQNDLGAYVPDNLMDRLKEVFEGLSVRGASEVVSGDAACRAAQMAAAAAQAEDSTVTTAPEIWKPFGKWSYMNLRRVQLKEAVRRARRNRSIIILDFYSLLPEAVVPMAAELRKELRFKPSLREYAQDKLHRLRETTFPEHDDEVVFVAVHARRTDYHAQLKLLYDVRQPADAGFFVRAATWLQRELSSNQGLLLVVTSDDPVWAKVELIPALNLAGEIGGWTAAWGSNGDSLRPESDLALLSACNHTIFAYGTFGLAAALAAGGRVAVYQLARTPLHPTLLSPSEQFARHLPGWVALR